MPAKDRLNARKPLPPEDALPALTGDTSVDDLACLYHLLLGRDAEPHVLRAPPGRALQDITREMAASEELRDQVLHALVHTRPVPHTRLKDEQLQLLDDWLTARLNCPPAPALEGAAALADEEARAMAPTAAHLLTRAYAHPTLAMWMERAHGSLFTQALDDLAKLHRAGRLQLEGKIEFVNREYISGWALDTSGKRGTLQVEVRHQGRLVATAGAHSYRPDIHQRYEGEGLAGFRAKWSPADFRPGLAVDFTLHEASTGVQLGAPYRFGNHFTDQLNVAQMLAKEFEEIQRRLDVLAGMVPQAMSYAAFPLEHYDLYRRVHRVPPPRWLAAQQQAGAQQAPSPRGVLRVLLAVQQAGATLLRQSVDSLRAQAGQADGRLRMMLGVVGGDAEARAAAAMLGAADPRVQALDDWDAARQWLDGGAAPALPGEADWVLLMGTGEILDVQSLAWLAQAQADVPQAVALFWNEDRLLHAEGRAPVREPRHLDPLLRDPFDAEALLELNGVGLSLAVRRDALVQALARVDACAPVPAEAADDEDDSVPWPALERGPGLPTEADEADEDALLDQEEAAGPERAAAERRRRLAHDWRLRPGPRTRATRGLAHALAPRRREWLLWALVPLGELAHLPQPLLSRVGEPGRPPESAENRLARHLARATPQSLAGLLPPAWQGRLWSRVPDPVCPSLPKGLVRWQPQQPGARLAVIIPTRDYIHLVRDCVGSLLRHALRPADLDIIVVDNGSVEPETAEYLATAQAAGQLRCMRVDEPFNWSRLNNLAAAATDAPYLLFLNNDTLMLTPEWDDVLRGLLERPDVGAVGARLLYEDMTIQHAGILFGVERFAAHEGVGEQPDAEDAPLRTQLSRTVRGVTGAFLACRRSTFERVGPFEDQHLTVAYNDVEWCLRLGERAPDLAIVYAPLLSLIHLESKSRGFDFQDLGKQRRADYERQCLDRSSMGALLRASTSDESVHSAWASPRRTLR